MRSFFNKLLDTMVPAPSDDKPLNEEQRYRENFCKNHYSSRDSVSVRMS